MPEIIYEIRWQLVLAMVGGPAILICLSWFLPTGPITKYFSGSPDTEPTTPRQEAVRAEQNKELKLLEKEIGTDDWKQPDYVVAKIHKAIQYAIDRHDWYEDQRFRVLQTHVSISLFVLTSIGIALRVGKTLSDLEVWQLIGIASTATTGLTIILILFNKELDSDRPYRLISDIRFWFYRYLIKSDAINLEKTNGDELVRNISGIREGFFEKVVENFDIKNQSGKIWSKYLSSKLCSYIKALLSINLDGRSPTI